MSALEAALEAIQQTDADELDKAKAMGLMVGYNRKWDNTEWECIEVEQQFHVPLFNPETGRKSRLFTHAGKYDGVMRYRPSGKLYLREVKTTSENIADLGSNYWQRLAIDNQVSGYTLAKWYEGERVDGVVYDVIRKPGISPKKIAKAEAQRILVASTYCGRVVSGKAKEYIMTGNEKENPELYMHRLVSEVVDNPDKYYQRRTIPRLDGELMEYARELWHTAHEIQDARKYGIHCKNPQACMTYGTPCEYLGICSGYDSANSDNWTANPNVHRELEIEDGRGVITNSRISCFRQCHRKHQLRYELGLERVDREESHAIRFGSLLHEALDAYWSFLKGVNDEHSTDADAANAATSQEVRSG